jgi:stage II sporulation protein D
VVGVTESSENVYGTDIPYLQSVKELYDVNSPHSNWQVKLSSDKINEVFKGIKGSIGHINDISILERNSSGRVGKVLLSGTSGEKIISGEELRKIFGLKSTLFDIVGNKTSLDLDISILTGNGSTHNVSNLKGIQVFSQGQNRSIKGGGINILGYSKQRTIDDFVKTSPDSYVVEGRGWGHGIGMNQWGAKAMAEQGHDYINILQHYYKNIEINQYNNK